MTASKTEASSTKSRNFLGITPFQWTTDIESDGTFKVNKDTFPIYSDFVKFVVVFTAEPPPGATNLYIRQEIYHTAASFQAGNKAPDGIFFDMTKPQAQ